MSMWRALGGWGCLCAAIDCLNQGLSGEPSLLIPAWLAWVNFLAAAFWVVAAIAVWRGLAR